ncbi:hypothetical protein [Paenibacillus chibensis]|uniref:hypothetical protein n=1 Tax=Paenibacillus chibensis TaxID=59846 RepID=UPI0013E301A0|nr:hypothetical protein [Paenibacillus chibensis]
MLPPNFPASFRKTGSTGFRNTTGYRPLTLEHAAPLRSRIIAYPLPLESSSSGTIFGEPA